MKRPDEYDTFNEFRKIETYNDDSYFVDIINYSDGEIKYKILQNEFDIENLMFEIEDISENLSDDLKNKSNEFFYFYKYISEFLEERHNKIIRYKFVTGVLMRLFYRLGSETMTTLFLEYMVNDAFLPGFQFHKYCEECIEIYDSLIRGGK